MDSQNNLQAFYQVLLLILKRYIFTPDMMINLFTLILSALGAYIIYFFTSKKRLHAVQIKLIHSKFAKIAPHVQRIAYLFILMCLLIIIVPVFQILKIPVLLLEFSRNFIIIILVLRIALLMMPKTPRMVFIIAFACFVTIIQEFGLLESIVKFLDRITFKLGEIQLTVLKLIYAAIVVTIAYLILSIIRDQIKRVIKNNHVLNPAQKVLTLKFVTIGLVVVMILVGLAALGISLTTIALFTGAIGFGIGIGLQKIFLNLLSGFIILFDRSIKPGDVITVGNTFGWVNSLHGRYVSVITRDGREHLIPNEKFISESVENWSYSSSAVRVRINVPVSDSSDLYKAAQILLDVSKDHPRILEKPEPRALILDIKESAVHFELGVWIQDPTEGISNVRSDLLFKILEEFRIHDIDLPSLERRVTIVHEEGKVK